MTELLRALLDSASLQTALQHLVSFLRQSENAAEALRALQLALKQAPAARDHLAGLLHGWLKNAQLYTGLVQTGIHSRQGFFRELKRRLYDRINPPPPDPDEFGNLLQRVLRPDDLAWLNRIPPRQWLLLYRELDRDETLRSQTHRHVRAELLYAAEMLSLWIAAEDLDPDLIRIDPRLLDNDSPFISLQREVQIYIDADRAPEQQSYDTAQLEVMLQQSREQVARLKRLGSHKGATLAVAHLLQRLEQSLSRLQSLIAILDSGSVEKSTRAFLELLAQIISSGLEQRSIRHFVRNTAGMLSKSISANTSEHGEHYIANTRGEYWQMLRSAAGAGFIIALMALLKIQIARLGLSPLASTVLSALNYGFGFVLVHLAGFTIATKQPAMTAARIASAIETGQKSRAMEKHIAELLVGVNRSQSIAVVGNIGVAMLVALLIAWLYRVFVGDALLSADEVAYQLHALEPLAALWYAAIAALWLFCAGIISGYYDNRADYLQLQQRLSLHPALAWLGEARRARLADYLHENFGALHGNFFFGVLLGVTPYIGELLKLPLDIRHIAFSSANLSYSAGSAILSPATLLLGFVHVLLIGAVNLWVSFFLALRVALRARDSSIPSIGKLLRALRLEIRTRPRNLLLPPKAEKPVEKEKSAEKEKPAEK